MPVTTRSKTNRMKAALRKCRWSNEYEQVNYKNMDVSEEEKSSYSKYELNDSDYEENKMRFKYMSKKDTNEWKSIDEINFADNEETDEEAEAEEASQDKEASQDEDINDYIMRQIASNALLLLSKSSEIFSKEPDMMDELSSSRNEN